LIAAVFLFVNNYKKMNGK